VDDASDHERENAQENIEQELFAAATDAEHGHGRHQGGQDEDTTTHKAACAARPQHPTTRRYEMSELVTTTAQN
jgi:hypothetical protein